MSAFPSLLPTCEAEVSLPCSETDFSQEDVSKSLLTQLENQQQTKQECDQIKPGEPISFIGITLRNIGKRLSAGGKFTPRQLKYQKAPPAWVTAHKSWKAGAPCTACRQLSRSGRDLSRWFHWGLFQAAQLPFFQAVSLVSASAGQLGLSGSGCLQS